ncbi:MAG TPA: TrkH family potassium uptake protein [Clostridia bacterium]|nr:TrkH family potassium uptake protein [Clostridia bacterium]
MPPKAHLNAVQILAFGFAAIILIGALLLTLPFASRDGRSIPFLNALFTAGSATCVTGLIVYDTYTQFTFFGQAVILLLIQIGGIGFVSMIVMFALFFGRRIGLRERMLLAESLSSMQIGGVVKLVRRILIGSFIVESAGAALLAIRFIPEFGIKHGLWFSVFHSVSAFCNAGFDLIGIKTPYSSLTSYVGDPIVILTIASLIVVGGIGFIVWGDIIDHGLHIAKYKLHTKVVLTASAILIVSGAVLFLILERDRTLSGMRAGEALLAALFQSITPRTAGYNSVDMAALTEGGKALLIALMIIGASPGSTGGGMKTSTFSVILLALYASIRRHEDTNVFCHRLDDEVIRAAYRSAALYMMMYLIGAFVLCAAGDLSLTDALFETSSAIGTVGLSTGVTSQLPPVCKITLILMMYAGRVGSLTVFLAVAKRSSVNKLRNAPGSIIVG